MVEGRLRKFYEEVCLLDQTFVIDNETKVRKLVEQAGQDVGAPVSIAGFLRFQLGEGLNAKKVISPPRWSHSSVHNPLPVADGQSGNMQAALIARFSPHRIATVRVDAAGERLNQGRPWPKCLNTNGCCSKYRARR